LRLGKPRIAATPAELLARVPQAVTSTVPEEGRGPGKVGEKGAKPAADLAGAGEALREYLVGGGGWRSTVLAQIRKIPPVLGVVLTYGRAVADPFGDGGGGGGEEVGRGGGRAGGEGELRRVWRRG